MRNNIGPAFNVHDIRQMFADAYTEEDFVVDKSGCKVVELMGAQFIADEPSIFGAVNHDYIAREIEWYKSQSLNVNDIPGLTPQIWIDVADHRGLINSNYGYLVFNPENYSQYYNVFRELLANPYSRRAMMIYNRPSMWVDFNKDGKSDFICCTSVQYLIRDSRLYALVNFRSNDAIFGYRNDVAWQEFVFDHLLSNLQEKMPSLERGYIQWNAGSLHVYERHFWLLDHYCKTGEWNVSMKRPQNAE